MRTPEQDHASLEVELKKLEDKYSWDEAPAAVKRRMRTIKNRLSAKKSREQARDYVVSLEKSVQLLSKEGDLLAHRLAIVEAENKILQQVDERRMTSAQSNSDKDKARDTTAVPSNEGGGQEEPAVPSKPSLQLDALLLLLQTVAASKGPCPGAPSEQPGGGPQPTDSAGAPWLSTRRLLRLRALIAKRLTKRRLMGSAFRSGAGPAGASPEARAKAVRARIVRGMRATRSLQRRLRHACPPPI
mmetsp:Transcript_15067/g.37694  ORF Transcript_15067/g.37694 Transcript_15067/m.37694 type:complete len:244 (-) Transcript_15067:139-870(-)